LTIERTIKRLADRYDRLHVCFEAGPTGYGLYRQVRALGHDCVVVAPALIPVAPASLNAVRKRAADQAIDLSQLKPKKCRSSLN
jgi:transposase